MDAPPIAFAGAPRGKVAFQQLGDSPTPLVLVPPLAQHIEMMWEQPVFWRPIMRLASAFRFVQYDKLGTGLSDPSPARVSLDDRLQELSAVMDAAGVQRAWLLGLSEGGVIALAAAASMPERVLGVALVSSYSGNTALAEAAAFGPVPERGAWRAFFEEVIAHWGRESTVILRPIRHVGCCSASCAVTLASSDDDRPRKGPPEAVRIRRLTSRWSRPWRH